MATSIDQYLLVLLYQYMKYMQMVRMESIQDEISLHIILGCCRHLGAGESQPVYRWDFLLIFPIMELRMRMNRTCTCLKISAKKEAMLHKVLNERKGNGLKKGKPWLRRAVNSWINIKPRQEWTPILPFFRALVANLRPERQTLCATQI